MGSDRPCNSLPPLMVAGIVPQDSVTGLFCRNGNQRPAMGQTSRLPLPHFKRTVFCNATFFACCNRRACLPGLVDAAPGFLERGRRLHAAG